MHIHHVAVWTHQLETLRAFYETYFGATRGTKYTNSAKQYSSYFLTFESGASLELMDRPDIAQRAISGDEQVTGYAHLSFCVGSTQGVDALTRRLVQDGYRLVDGPRKTGDGYYESVIVDPDGNRVEINAG